MNQVFTIIANGKPAGVTVAPDADVASRQAQRALVRTTSSKEDSDADATITVLATGPKPEAKRSTWMRKAVERVQQAVNSRFIEAV